MEILVVARRLSCKQPWYTGLRNLVFAIAMAVGIALLYGIIGMVV